MLRNGSHGLQRLRPVRATECTLAKRAEQRAKRSPQSKRCPISEILGHRRVWTLVKPCPSCGRRLRSRQGAIPEALRQASVRRSTGRSTSVPLPRGHASSRSHALVDGTFRLSVREPEREIVRRGPGRAWRTFLPNGSIAATGTAAPGRRPPRISSDGLQTASRRADRPRAAIAGGPHSERRNVKRNFCDGCHCGARDRVSELVMSPAVPETV
jgi:hypothetical protein